MKHTMKDGTKIKIKDMSDSHLINTINMQLRMAKNGVTVSYGGGIDFEDIWFDQDTYFGEEALYHLKYKHYCKEAKRRGLVINSNT